MSPERRAPLFLALAVGLVAVAAGFWAARSDRGVPVRAGAPAPGFELPALDGDPIDLASYRGRVVFVNFWATWCAPCKEEAPALQRLHERLAAEGFAVLAISIDTSAERAEVERFRDEFALGFPILLDPEKAAYEAYQVYGVPETFLIDPAGRVAERFVGPRAWDDPRYARAVRRLAAAAEVAP